MLARNNLPRQVLHFAAVPDSVDLILEQWARERPDLDASPMGVVGRVQRISRELERALVRVFARFDLGQGEFDALATLRRSGEPYRLTPGALCESMMVTSGAVTKRVDRLERVGLVAREPDPDDRRGVLVGLTAEGLEMVDRVVEEHLENEQRLLADLTDAERERLARLLRALGESVRAAEQRQAAAPKPP
jgi:DNA-binding MarR family transcriptional regulator